MAEVIALIEAARACSRSPVPAARARRGSRIEAATRLVPELQGRRLLGRPRAVARPRARPRDDRPDARRQGRPGRAHRRARDAPPPRQPRAGRRRRARARRAPRACPNLAPRHEPRAAAGPGRGRVRGAAARRARSGRALLRARAARADDHDRRALPRLDYLPLAVELAAARTSVLSPAADPRAPGAAARPAQGRPRRRPAPADPARDDRVAYELPRRGAALFARLSVFAGGCTLDAAEEVCDADLDALQALVEKSLVRTRTSRYWMLETIREYARERLGGARGHGGCAAPAQARASIVGLAEAADQERGRRPARRVDRARLESGTRERPLGGRVGSTGRGAPRRAAAAGGGVSRGSG